MKPNEMFDEMVDTIFSESREQTISNQKIEKISETYKINDYVTITSLKDKWEIKISEEPGRTNPNKVSIFIEKNDEIKSELQTALNFVAYGLLKISKELGITIK
jgi:hypothetical protein